jgi:chorismate synthase
MSSEFGEKIKISIFGESHGPAIGVLIDGLPPGEEIDPEELSAFLARRAPGSAPYATARKEADRPRFLSGLSGGKTCGTPLCVVIENCDVRSEDYDAFRTAPRPGHADFTALARYGGYADMRGGGHFSGRLTAPLCVAGSICLQILKRRGVTVGAHIFSLGSVEDRPFDPVGVSPEELRAVTRREFPVLDPSSGERMKEEIQAAAAQGDSLGGIIECCALGLPAGIGEPMFGGVENRIAQAVFGIPAVRGLAFGAGFSAARMRGSEHNDPFVIRDGRVATKTNNHGGVLGGITSGMPLLFRAAIKPTPSIGLAQRTVHLERMEETDLEIKGRHDPCILPRAVPCMEAAAAAVLLDLMLLSGR